MYHRTLCSQFCRGFTHVLCTHLHIQISKYVCVYASSITRQELSLFWCKLFLLIFFVSIVLKSVSSKTINKKIAIKTLITHLHRVPLVDTSHGSGAGNDPCGLGSPKLVRTSSSARRSSDLSIVATRCGNGQRAWEHPRIPNSSCRPVRDRSGEAAHPGTATTAHPGTATTDKPGLRPAHAIRVRGSPQPARDSGGAGTDVHSGCSATGDCDDDES